MMSGKRIAVLLGFVVIVVVIATLVAYGSLPKQFRCTTLPKHAREMCTDARLLYLEGAYEEPWNKTLLVDRETFRGWGQLGPSTALWASEQSCSKVYFVASPRGVDQGVAVYVHEGDIENFDNFISYETIPPGCQPEKDN
jgi:hypothetical protein